MLSTKILKEKILPSEDLELVLNPLNSYILNDSGLLRIKEASCNPEFTSEKIMIKILEYTKYHNQDDLYLKFREFVEEFGVLKTSKMWELLYYSHELIITNYSAISFENIKKILIKLTSMLKSQYDPRIGEPSLFILSCLCDLAIPSSISQQELNTCSLTCIQTQLAIREPLEYLNIVEALAQNMMYFSLKKQLINTSWIFIGATNDSRTISAKLLQSAIFLICHPDAKSFINKGLTPDAAISAYKILFGDMFKLYEKSDYTSEQILEMIKNNNPSRTNPIQISINYADKGSHSLHAVNVIGFDNKLQDIKIINPWGREEIIDLEILKTRILFIISLSSSDQRIPRMPDKFFNIALNSKKLPWYKLNIFSKRLNIDISDEKLNKYLNCLNLEQKIDLIISLYSEKLKKKQKLMILKIIDNILQGSNYQNKAALGNLYNKLSIKGIKFFIMIDNLQVEHKLFDNIVQKIGLANSCWKELLKEILEDNFVDLDY